MQREGTYGQLFSGIACRRLNVDKHGTNAKTEFEMTIHDELPIDAFKPYKLAAHRNH
ncbi:MAG TPA: hypothetical protein VKV04_07490 [Verrucomicrobiae bacterium]|nr:hypothetical protein [Verrucomicrobiae bacterium]